MAGRPGLQSRIALPGVAGLSGCLAGALLAALWQRFWRAHAWGLLEVLAQREAAPAAIFGVQVLVQGCSGCRVLSSDLVIEAGRVAQNTEQAATSSFVSLLYRLRALSANHQTCRRELINQGRYHHG